jgi:serine/threonine-protein kinase
VANSQLKKVRLSGGTPLLIADSIANPRGASWGPDNVIVITPSNAFGRGGVLRRVSALGGPVSTVSTPDTSAGEASHRWPDLLPGGKAAVITVYMQGGRGTHHLGIVSLETGAIKHLPLYGTGGIYLESGHLAYATEGGTLITVPFDLDRLEPTGTPVAILTGVMVLATGGVQATVSEAGALAYVPGSNPDASLVMMTRDGDEEVIIDGLRAPLGPRFSPDGRRIAFQALHQGNSDIWIHDISQGTTARFTLGGDNRYPTWHPDGTAVSYSAIGVSGAPGRSIVSKPVDLSGEESPLVTGPGEVWEHVWLSDASALVLRVLSVTTATGRDLWYAPLASPDSARPILTTGFNERSPAVSPDDRWLAYASDESGQDQIFLRPLRAPGAPRQVSVDGGTEPAWAPDSRELFYRDGTDLVSVSFAPGIASSTRRVLFRDTYSTGVNYASYDVHPDGDRLVMVKGSSAAQNVVVVLNWFEEVKALVGN